MIKQFKIGVIFLLGLLLIIQLAGWFNRSAESAKRYQYKVISITGMTELRKQTEADQGRIAAIEKVINENAEQGWDFYQADGYVLYFRR